MIRDQLDEILDRIDAIVGPPEQETEAERKARCRMVERDGRSETDPPSAQLLTFAPPCEEIGPALDEGRAFLRVYGLGWSFEPSRFNTETDTTTPTMPPAPTRNGTV